jgi:hypothetical protein
MWFEVIGEAIGIEGGPRAIIGWTAASLFLAFAISRLPGLALVTLRRYRELRHELRTPKKNLTKQRSQRKNA